MTLTGLVLLSVLAAPHWFTMDSPPVFLWGEKDARGYIRGTIPPPGAPELKGVIAKWQAAHPKAVANFGVTMPPSAIPEVRGTDPELAATLAQTLAHHDHAANAPCPGPGPCPNPRKPDPAPAPIIPEPDDGSPVNWLMIGLAGAITVASGFVAVFGLLFLLIFRGLPPKP
jgi:hypothetical protein